MTSYYSLEKRCVILNLFFYFELVVFREASFMSLHILMLPVALTIITMLTSLTLLTDVSVLPIVSTIVKFNSNSSTDFNFL